ncbi:MAG: DUF2190 family protein [Phycisphaerae bacterium]|jgi:hypothetical protein
MQATYESSGETIDYTPGADVPADSIVVQGKLVGYTPRPLPAHQQGALRVQGVIRAAKDASNITGPGLPVFWNIAGNPVGGEAGSGCMTTTATGNVFAGWSLEAADPATGTVLMLLRSANDADTMGIDDLSDVGAVSHTAGMLLVADGTAWQSVSLSGLLALAASGALRMAVAAVAATGSTQAAAAAVAEGLTHATGADATKGVQLPTAAAGKVCVIKNSEVADAVLNVYPATDDAINALSADAAFEMPAKSAAVFVALDDTTWVTVPRTPS